MAHCYQSVGVPATGYYTELPASSVYRDTGGKLVVVGWNPLTASVPITVYKDGKELGKASIPASSLTTLKDLAFLRGGLRFGPARLPSRRWILKRACLRYGIPPMDR